VTQEKEGKMYKTLLILLPLDGYQVQFCVRSFILFYDCHSFLTIKGAIYCVDVHTDWRLKGIVAHRKIAVNLSVSMMYAFFTNDAIQTKLLRLRQAFF
jgi:hypothetical protein